MLRVPVRDWTCVALECVRSCTRTPLQSHGVFLLFPFARNDLSKITQAIIPRVTRTGQVALDQSKFPACLYAVSATAELGCCRTQMRQRSPSNEEEEAREAQHNSS